MAKFRSNRVHSPFTRRVIIPPASGLEAGFASVGGGPYPANAVINTHTCHTYGNQDYNTPWMLQSKIGTNPVNSHVRCEVRPGYSGLLTDNVAVNQRATFAADEEYQLFNTNYWTSVAIKIPVGDANSVTSAAVVTGSWFHILEWRHTADAGDAAGLASPMQLQWIGEDRLRFETHGSNTNPLLASPTQVNRWDMSTFTRGVWWYFVLNHVWSPSGSGKVVLYAGTTFPLTQVINDTSIALGYNDVSGPTFRLLAYRGYNPVITPTDKQVIYFANPEWGTTDLTARISTPLAIP